MPKLVLFDLGGVLIDWDPRHLYRKIMPREEMEFFLGKVCTPAWNLRMDAGRPFAEGIAEKQAEWPAYREAIGFWRSRWDEMVAGPIQGTVDLLAELKAKDVPLCALTNWSAETFPSARARFGFLAWFRDIIVSGEEGLAKPDPAFFALATARCGAAPGDTVFIDDVAGNVEAARTLGYDAILFQGPGPLREQLAARGLL